MSPTTKAEWWSLVNEHWDNLWEIFLMFVPNHDFDWGSDVFVESKEPDVLTKIQRAKEARDGHALARHLNAAWATAPDDRSIHSIPSWGVLCDLCSEEYVLYQDEEELKNLEEEMANLDSEWMDLSTPDAYFGWPGPGREQRIDCIRARIDEIRLRIEELKDEIARDGQPPRTSEGPISADRCSPS